MGRGSSFNKPIARDVSRSRGLVKAVAYPSKRTNIRHHLISAHGAVQIPEDVPVVELEEPVEEQIEEPVLSVNEEPVLPPIEEPIVLASDMIMIDPIRTPKSGP